MPAAVSGAAMAAVARLIGVMAGIAIEAGRRPAIFAIRDVARLGGRLVGGLLDRHRGAGRQRQARGAANRAEKGTAADRPNGLHPLPSHTLARPCWQGRNERLVTPTGFEPVALRLGI